VAFMIHAVHQAVQWAIHVLFTFIGKEAGNHAHMQPCYTLR
jgi:hypothetical protein